MGEKIWRSQIHPSLQTYRKISFDTRINFLAYTQLCVLCNFIKGIIYSRFNDLIERI